MKIKATSNSKQKSAPHYLHFLDRLIAIIKWPIAFILCILMIVVCIQKASHAPQYFQLDSSLWLPLVCNFFIVGYSLTFQLNELLFYPHKQQSLADFFKTWYYSEIFFFLFHAIFGIHGRYSSHGTLPLWKLSLFEALKISTFYLVMILTTRLASKVLSKKLNKRSKHIS